MQCSSLPRWVRWAAALGFLAGFVPGVAGCGDGEVIEGSSAYDVERYDLAAEYDWGADRLRAVLTLSLQTTDSGLTAIALDSAVASVSSVRDPGGADLPFSVDAAAQLLTVDVSSFGGRFGGAIRLEIAYEVAAGESLRAVPWRVGDPVSNRVLYTDSEPDRAREWMPCHDRPDDRAVFSIDMKMDGGEKLIANGELVLDEGGETHRMKYQTDYPLPPYLMAFAVGDFEVEEAEGGDVPISVWHRPGVTGDYPGTLADLTRLMDTFQALLGPYPFEKYSLVMLPSFSGGMENAGISFQSEVSTAQPSLSGNLNAHEFGHQWFGDLVTVATWDDVWIKEGMATLLGEEASRPFEDQSARGTLFGDRFYATQGEAIRDVTLAPFDKYNSGPYDRGAWLYSQIRHLVGEDLFWSTVRGILEEHRFGTVSTDQVLAAFAPHLGKDAAARAARAVDARNLPSLDLAPAANEGVIVTLRDPEETLLAPFEIEWHRGDGTVEKQTLIEGQPLTLERTDPGDFLVVDPVDVHPTVGRWIFDDASWESHSSGLLPLLLPQGPANDSPFAEISGVHQFGALTQVGLPAMAPDELAGFAASLDADSARIAALAAACTRASLSEDPAERQAWTEVLSTAAAAEPAWHGLAYTGLGACGDVVPMFELVPFEWADLAIGLGLPTLTPERVNYLASFRMTGASAVDIWHATANAAYSLRVRVIAAQALRRAGGPEPSPGWLAAILDVMARTDASEVQRQLISAAPWFVAAPEQDQAALLEALRRILRSPVLHPAHAQALCAAYGFTLEKPGTWQSFAQTIADAPLSRSAQKLLGNPTACL